MPPIPAAPWNPSDAAPVLRLPSEGEEPFLQRCKLACVQMDECVGFVDTQCSPGGRCCQLHQSNQPGSGYFLPSRSTYIKRRPAGALSSAAVKTTDQAKAGATTVVINPWDDSYGMSEVDSDGAPSTHASALRVELSFGHALADWRVLLSTLFVFGGGLFIGGTLTYIYALRGEHKRIRTYSDEQRMRAASKAVDAAGPAPGQKECYAQGVAFASTL